jgi:hypothetical protein
MSNDNIIKPLAFYFPQFHRMPENDKLWGEGFTEWNNLKSWTPKYEGHKLKSPAWGFYNLEDRSVRSMQYEYARSIGLLGLYTIIIVPRKRKSQGYA